METEESNEGTRTLLRRTPFDQGGKKKKKGLRSPQISGKKKQAKTVPTPQSHTPYVSFHKNTYRPQRKGDVETLSGVENNIAR